MYSYTHTYIYIYVYVCLYYSPRDVFDPPFPPGTTMKAALLRGQIYNLTTALKDQLSPWQLVQMPLCSISKDGRFKYQVCMIQLG